MSVDLATRERYRPDRGMRWARLPLMLGIPLATAAGVAWGLNRLFQAEHYYVFFVPFLGALLLAGLTHCAVGWAHCRKPLLAGFVGLTAGLVGYLGYYHLGLLEFLPPGMAHRVDLLPGWIQFRMQTDVQVDVGRPDDGDELLREPTKLDVGFNWFSFAMELALMAGFASVVGWNRARRAYSPETGRWMEREQVRIQPGASGRLREAFEAGDMEQFVERALAARASQQNPASCTIEFVPGTDESPLAHPVYLSIEDPTGGSGAWRAAASAFDRRPRVRQILLEPRETLALRPLFPGLAAALARVHEKLRGVAELEVTEVIPEPLLPDAVQVAEITPVPSPYGGTVMTRAHIWITNLIGGSTLILFFGGLGLLALGASQADADQIPPAAVAAFVAGGFGVLLGGVIGVWYPLLPECLYSHWKLRNAIRRRPDPLVDADDPEAVSVGITPRENWAKVKLETASDIGLLRLDRGRGEIQIEGDVERFRIPAGSLLVCEPERFFHPLDKNTEHWMVRLVVRLKEGPTREVLFGISHTDFVPRTNSVRRAKATAMCTSIRALLPEFAALETT